MMDVTVLRSRRCDRAQDLKSALNCVAALLIPFHGVRGRKVWMAFCAMRARRCTAAVARHVRTSGRSSGKYSRSMRIPGSQNLLMLLVAGLFAVIVLYQGMSNGVGGILPMQAVAHADGASPVQVARASTGQPSFRANDVRMDFAGASDLYAYRHRLRAKEAAGDPAALWEVSQVIEYCAAFASNPAGYAGDTRQILEMKGWATAAMASARDRVSNRCQRFVPEDGFSLASLRAKRIEAASAGSLAAEAALLAMGESLSSSNEYKQDLVRRVLDSADPQAFLALSSVMGVASSGQEAYFGRVSGSQYSEWAWQIAACRLGADCSAHGVLMTSYCANGGICSRDSSQDFYTFVLDAGVSRQGVDNLNAMVDSLMSDIGVRK
ncbi:MAG: hypothetical protein ABI858_03245 [Pseudoxanthomonas sp.]